MFDDDHRNDQAGHTPRVAVARSIVAVQLGLVFLFFCGISGWLHLPNSLVLFVGGVVLFFFLTLPVWGTFAAKCARLSGAKLVVFIIIQCALWFAMLLILLPAVQ